MNDELGGTRRAMWHPTADSLESCLLARFQKVFFDRIGRANDRVSAYADLHVASIEHREVFWEAVWDFCGVEGEKGLGRWIEGKRFQDGQWFPDAKLNFAEELLKPSRILQDAFFACSIAVLTCNEQGEATEWTREQLMAKVVQVAYFLREQGVERGDRVVAVLPNVVEAVIAFLATASLGAIWSTCSPEFGDDAICDRFSQIDPKVMVTSTEAIYGGKKLFPLRKVQALLDRMPTLQAILTVGTLENDSKIPTFTWNQLGEPPHREAMLRFSFERFPFQHPLCIVFSSGTTGRPKCIVHGVGGTLLQHLKEHQLHCDLSPGDRLFYYTTTGWMMWNWLVSGLASRSTIVLFDGSPLTPGPEVLWEYAEKQLWTHFGASARYFSTLEKAAFVPQASFPLRSLRCVLSTGSPLLPESFDWIYRSVSDRINLASISGGTDILSCFVLGNPMLPVMRGEIQCKGLGMDVAVVNERGESMVEQAGELVCRQPFPSMPICFYNDPDGMKYANAYFERFPGMWHHGDWAKETEAGGYIIYGRSDATLNPAGVRIGTAEIYQQVETFPEILESLATAWRSQGDESIVLFLKLRAGEELDARLVDAIRQRLKSRCSPRHVPAYIVQAPDLPRTMSGKLSEIAVRSALAGQKLGNDAALANPDSLKFFREWKPKS